MCSTQSGTFPLPFTRHIFSAPRRRIASYKLEVRCIGLPALGGDIEAHPLAFVQRREPGALDCADMDEHVPPAAVGLEEPEALTRIKPFHFACRHHILRVCLDFMSAARAA